MIIVLIKMIEMMMVMIISNIYVPNIPGFVQSLTYTNTFNSHNDSVR